MKLKVLKSDKGFVLAENRLVNENEFYIDSIHRKLFQWKMGRGIHQGKSAWCDVVIATDITFKLENIPQFHFKQPEFKKESYSQEDMMEFGLWLGNNYKKSKGKLIEDIFKIYIDDVLKYACTNLVAEVVVKDFPSPITFKYVPHILRSQEYPEGLILVKNYFYE